MEVIGRIGRGREPGNKRSHGQQHDFAHAPQREPRAKRCIGAGGRPGKAALIGADEGKVAANDIWKLGWTTASGTSSMTASAATAMVRMVSVARSIMTPTKTTAIMMKERLVFPAIFARH